LLTRALRQHGDADARVLSRISIEILGPVPLVPCRVSVETVRGGKRIELLRARLESDGKTLLLAEAWRLQAEPGVSPNVPHPYAPPPLPPEQPQIFFKGVGPFGYGEAMEWRYVAGAFDRSGPATLWARPRIPLVEGEADHPLDSLLLMLDSANGASAELDVRQWSFVPVDLVVGLYRQPAGTWFGMDARTVIGDAGIGQSSTVVFDASGVLGQSLHTLFVRPR
jgi:hypothetical protein